MRGGWCRNWTQFYRSGRGDGGGGVAQDCVGTDGQRRRRAAQCLWTGHLLEGGGRSIGAKAAMPLALLVHNFFFLQNGIDVNNEAIAALGFAARNI